MLRIAPDDDLTCTRDLAACSARGIHL